MSNVACNKLISPERRFRPPSSLFPGSRCNPLWPPRRTPRGRRGDASEDVAENAARSATWNFKSAARAPPEWRDNIYTRQICTFCWNARKSAAQTTTSTRHFPGRQFDTITRQSGFVRHRVGLRKVIEVARGGKGEGRRRGSWWGGGDRAITPAIIQMQISSPLSWKASAEHNPASAKGHRHAPAWWRCRRPAHPRSAGPPPLLSPRRPALACRLHSPACLAPSA